MWLPKRKGNKKQKKKKEEYKKEERTITISKLLKTVYADIEQFGMEDDSFNRGIMYPLYKKKDKTKIENYRPLTMLETDYKILTKVLSQKLGVVAPDLIHENQAGFVPGRSLYDHIKLAQLMPDYAESDFKDGLIVSLDQEKAYNKIDHNYLWQMMAKYNFPQKFT